MNQNAESIKKALNTYKAATDKSRQQIDYITSTYGKEAGEAEKEIQKKNLEKARKAAVDLITQAAGAGYREAEAWGRLDGSKLDNDDVRLLEAGLVDNVEFNRLKEKHANNFTMLQTLKKYGEKQNQAQTEEARKNNPDSFIMQEPFNVRDIPSAGDKMKKWEKTQAQALDLLDAMDGSGKYTNPDSWDAAFVRAAMPETLQNFGEWL